MSAVQSQKSIPPKPKLLEQVGYDLRAQHYRKNTFVVTVKAAGGKWNKKKRLSELPYGEAVELRLQDGIMEEVN